jgi:hypothetical protein
MEPDDYQVVKNRLEEMRWELSARTKTNAIAEALR